MINCVLKLVKECIEKESYDDGEELRIHYKYELGLIIENISEIVDDLIDIDSYVWNYINEYYSIAFSLNKQPCIVTSKGNNKIIYKWE